MTYAYLGDGLLLTLIGFLKVHCCWKKEKGMKLIIPLNIKNLLNLPMVDKYHQSLRKVSSLNP